MLIPPIDDTYLGSINPPVRDKNYLAVSLSNTSISCHGKFFKELKVHNGGLSVVSSLVQCTVMSGP